MIDIKKEVEKVEADTVKTWKHLHRNPELSGKEFQTSAYVEKILREETSVDRIYKVGETGLLVEIIGKIPGEGKAMLLRGDMDALPVTEETGLPYASQNPGVMHACGHDVHTSVLLGTVRVLDGIKDKYSGRIFCFFQPAEETLSGARTLLEDSSLPFDEIQGAVALHVSPEIPAGTIGIKRGPILAAPDLLEVTIHGRQGHAAHPDTVRDPITAAAQLIMSLQTLVSRDTSATDSSVISFGTIQGGAVSNIIPEEVTLSGTLRTLNPDTRKLMHQRISDVCEGVSKTTRTEITCSISMGPPPLICSEEWFERVCRAGTQLLGPENVIIMERPSMGGEDFAYIIEKKPGAFIRLGSRTPGGPYGSMHSPTYYSDESCLKTGMITMVGTVLDFLGTDE